MPGSSSGGFPIIARAWKESAISRCWTPSCRSRSIRRRASSPAATILLRDAESSAAPSAFAIAVATSSVNEASRTSVSGGSGPSFDVAVTVPQRRPSTTIGLPTADFIPASLAATPIGSVAAEKSSIRAAWPVWCTNHATFVPSIGHRLPVGNAASVVLHEATVVTLSSGSKRPIVALPTGNRRPTSSATASKRS
jgi:hypothetical protein